EINKRIFREVEISDLVLFLFDGRRELLGYEKELFLEIRKINDRIISIINKVDNPRNFALPTSYYSLKQELLYISAEHKNGIDELLEEIEKKFENYTKPAAAPEEADEPLRVSIMGKPNVGKSSIVNKILNDDFVIVSPIAGTTRDSVDLEIKRKNKTFILVDNAGIRK
ncbi:MAG: ribosome biogenesis GTPase Der, partial [bacterium]|nr:ribosome biogenesis GTPase Der [bacterium]